MSEKIRINGYDTYAPTRTDTISNRKAVRGRTATTFANDPEQKKKINLYFDSNRDFLEQLEELLRNPHFAISKVKSAKLLEKQMLHGYRFQHSIGDIDFVSIESIEFGDYGMLINEVFISNKEWFYLIDETFSVANGFTNLGVLSYKTISTGNVLQNSKSVTWINIGLSTTDALSLYDSQAVYSTDGLVGKLHKRFSNIELEAWISARVIPATVYLYFGLNGYWSTTQNTGHAVVVDTATQQLQVVSTTTNGTTNEIFYTQSLTDKTFTAGVDWYKIRIVILGKTIAVFFDDTFLTTLILPELNVGDIGLKTTNFNVDRVRVKSLPKKVLGTPPNSKTGYAFISNTIKSAYGTQERIINENSVNYDHGAGNVCVLNLKFNGNTSELADLSDNNNDGIIRGGIWEDGYLDHGLRLSKGDLKVDDNITLQNLKNKCTIRLRFKINTLHTQGIGIGEVIAGRGNDWAVYDYNDAGVHKIAFEMAGRLLIGNIINANVWYEFYFLTEGMSLFIYRTDNFSVPQPEARLWIQTGGTSFIYPYTDYSTETCLNSLGRNISDLDITFDDLEIYKEFILPTRTFDSITNVKLWKIPEDSIGNRHMKSLILDAPFNESELYDDGLTHSKIRNIYHPNAFFISDDSVGQDFGASFSPFSPSAARDLEGDWISNLNETDIFMDSRIYEASWSFWWFPQNFLSNSLIYNTRFGSTGVSITQLSTGQLEIIYSDDIGNKTITTTTANLSTLIWYKLDITYNYGTLKIYKNGIEILSNTESPEYFIPSSGLTIRLGGELTAYGNRWDIFKMFDRVLTPAEIKILFVSDPIYPYYLNKQIFSLRHNYNTTDAIFIENGIFGIFISKGLRSGALSKVGSIEFLYWDIGWESIGWMEVDKT